MKTKITLTILIIFLLGFSLNVFAQDFPYISLTGPSAWVRDVSFSPDGETIATLHADNYIRFWDANTGTFLKAITQDTFNQRRTVHQRRLDSWVNRISFSPDGTILASALHNDHGGSRVDSVAVRLWDVSTSDLLFTRGGHTNGVNSISFSPDGKTLASASSDNTVRLWDVSTGNYIRSLTGHKNPVQDVLFSLDGKTLVSSSSSNVRLWDANTGKSIRTLTGRRYLDFSPDGKTVVGYADGDAHLWDANTGSLIRTLTGHTGGIYSRPIFSPDGKMLAAGGDNSTVHLWEVSTGRTIRTLTGPVNSATYAVAFSSDGQKLVSGYGNGTCHVWDLPTTRVSITPAAVVSPAVGDPLTINISIVGGKSVSAYQVQLGFDETALKHVSSVNGNFLPAGAFFIPPVVETNKVTLSATSLSGGASDGDGSLATVTFEAVEVKESFIDILEVTLTDSQGIELQHLTQGTRVEASFPGDINKDGVVNIQDLVLVAASFGQPVTEEGNLADVNGDGQVNVIDLVLVSSALGNSASAPSALAQAQETALKRSDVQQWLSQAQQLNLTDATAQSGIRFLEQLLTVLTPNETLLLANYPNPFNPETWIPYQLAESADVSLTIHAVDGSVVRTLTLGHQPVGIYQDKDRAAYWDGRNAQGEPVASGVYFYTLTAGEFKSTRKMLIRK